MVNKLLKTVCVLSIVTSIWLSAVGFVWFSVFDFIYLLIVFSVLLLIAELNSGNWIKKS